MPEYKVTWTIEVAADSPKAAAELAREYQLDPESTADVFTVDEYPYGIASETVVDLSADRELKFAAAAVTDKYVVSAMGTTGLTDSRPMDLEAAVATCNQCNTTRVRNYRNPVWKVVEASSGLPVHCDQLMFQE